MNFVRGLYHSLVDASSAESVQAFKQHCHVVTVCYRQDRPQSCSSRDHYSQFCADIVERTHLNAIKKLLIEEGRELRSAGGSTNAIGPCGEHLLKSQIFDLISEVACVKEPPGLLEFALLWTADVLEDMPDALIAHTAISRVRLQTH